MNVDELRLAAEAMREEDDPRWVPVADLLEVCAERYEWRELLPEPLVKPLDAVVQAHLHWQ